MWSVRDEMSFQSGDHGKYETGGRDLREIKSIDILRISVLQYPGRSTDMGKKDEKTNVMRILEQKKIPYNSYNYLSTGAISGVEVAQALGEDPDIVFKTLVTVGKSKEHYVFVIPVEKELNLKKAAKSVGEKSIEMIKQKELLPLTGYVHGGCSPIGMKKQFTTTIDKSAGEHEKIIFSAGKIGYQVEVALADLEKVVRFQLAEVAE